MVHLGVMYLGRRGGVCRTTYELVSVLSGLARVTCYLSAGNELLDAFGRLDCRVRTVETYRGLPSMLWSMISRRRALDTARTIIADAPDVLLDTCSGPWLGVIERKIRGKVPLACIIHDVDLHPDRLALMNRVYRRLYPFRAEAFVGLSEFSVNQLRSRFPNVRHILMRHPVHYSSEAVDADRAASNRHRLLCFGRIEKYKGVEILVDAFGIAKSSNPALELDIIGQGPLSSRTLRKISALGIGLRNEYVPDHAVPGILASHGVVILPYLVATQSGVAAAAMGNGLPMIATSTGGLPEQVVHGRNGLIVPPGDAAELASAILTISNDAEPACSMSKEARLMAETTFSWGQIAGGLLEDLVALCRDQGKVVEEVALSEKRA